jgi:hypothetical protein
MAEQLNTATAVASSAADIAHLAAQGHFVSCWEAGGATTALPLLSAQ